MRVVVIADFADAGGGAQRVALESARALAEAGVAVTYVHAVGESGTAALGHPFIEDIGFGPAGRAGGAQRHLERARGRTAEERARRPSARPGGDPPPPVDPRLLAGDPAGRVPHRAPGRDHAARLLPRLPERGLLP